jgi:hypothetical protein
MTAIKHIELEREDNSGTQAVRTQGPGPGDIPVDDPPPAEHPEEAPGEPGEAEIEAQARESVKAFERALGRIPPG